MNLSKIAGDVELLQGNPDEIIALVVKLPEGSENLDVTYHFIKGNLAGTKWEKTLVLVTTQDVDIKVLRVPPREESWRDKPSML